MDNILGVIGNIPVLSFRKNDDFADRLSHRYTVGLLVIFTIIVTTTQLVGDPINCWVPAHFSGSWQTYTDSYCWVRNTYYLPFQEHIPKAHEDDKRQMVTYYQWMPIILLIQALLFYLPNSIWEHMSAHSGIDLTFMVETGRTVNNTDKAELRVENLKAMTTRMDRYLNTHMQGPSQCSLSIKHIFARTCFRMCGRHHGNYLITTYLFCKLVYIANCIGQIFALNIFLGQDFNMYGIEAVRSVISGGELTPSPRFPRVTMCDLKIRRLGNLHPYTVQCVLPINLFNEAIYLFIWFWMVLLSALICFSLLTWAMRISFRSDRHRYIKKHLRLLNKLRSDNRDTDTCTRFIDKYLKQDGVFMLRLVGHNTNAITVTEFVGSLWDNFKSKGMINMDESIDEHTGSV